MSCASTYAVEGGGCHKFSKIGLVSAMALFKNWILTPEHLAHTSSYLFCGPSRCVAYTSPFLIKKETARSLRYQRLIRVRPRKPTATYYGNVLVLHSLISVYVAAFLQGFYLILGNAPSSIDQSKLVIHTSSARNLPKNLHSNCHFRVY